MGTPFLMASCSSALHDDDVVCGLHDVDRCPLASWYLLVWHVLHVRTAVFESAEMYLPFAHVACVLQVVVRWEASSWYVPAGHAAHAAARA